MTFEQLHTDMQVALKEGDTTKRIVLSDMIAMIQKISTSGKTRVEITEDLINEALIKYQKTVQEMIDTCPTERAETLAEYKKEMDIVKQYAPQLMTDESQILSFIESQLAAAQLEKTKSNRGKIMKILAPLARGKMDMKIVNKVISEILV